MNGRVVDRLLGSYQPVTGQACQPYYICLPILPYFLLSRADAGLDACNHPG
jgi:hypothetical protein